MQRKSGVLLPIFSLDSGYGIGDFGKSGYNFVDFLRKSKQKIWQILPLAQTGLANSPYSSVSLKSYNPLFISPELLFQQKLITKKELSSLKTKANKVDYSLVQSKKMKVLRKAFLRFNIFEKGFQKFLKKKEQHSYALFMAIKNKNNGACFLDWEDGLKRKEENAIKDFEKYNKQEIMFWEFVQYIAKTQWLKLKKYANKKGISIFGDMPFYPSLDSVDVWDNSQYFKLDKDLNPTKVAGVPPDYFCEDGQLWGNPVYDYEIQEKDNFSFWKDRIKDALTKFDIVRIDHFRALDRYYEIDFNSTSAKEGEWVTSPGKKLIDSINSVCKEGQVIAEDLGMIDDGVRNLLAYSKFYGMKVLSFAFDGNQDNLYLPKNIQSNFVCYTGTHDNDTILGLIKSVDKNQYIAIKKITINCFKEQGQSCQIKNRKDLARQITKLGFYTLANVFIIPMQDILLLDNEYRINVPGLVSDKNWSIIINKKYYNLQTIGQLKQITMHSKRG